MFAARAFVKQVGSKMIALAKTALRIAFLLVRTSQIFAQVTGLVCVINVSAMKKEDIRENIVINVL